MPFFTRIIQVLRGSDWWNYKLPPLFAVVYWGMATSGLQMGEGLLRLALLLVWMIGAAGFGHYLNDWSDIEADRKVGKSNAAAKHGKRKRFLILSLLAATALLPWIYLASNIWAWCFVIFHLSLFFWYSVFPRFKELADIGITSDSLYAHVLPTIIVALPFFNNFNAQSGCVMLLAAWAFFYGLRNIIGHQIGDYENDKKSGTHTFVIEKGRDFAVHRIRLLVLFEFTGFVIAWLSSELPFNLVVPVAFVLFLAYRWWLYDRVWKLRLDDDWGIPAYNSFLNNFYELYFPLAVLLAASIQKPAFAWLIPVHLTLFAKNTLNAAAEWRSLVK